MRREQIQREMSAVDPVFELFEILALGFGVTLLMTMLARLANGASPCQLWRTRFYEIPPLRALIHLLHLTLWLFTAACLVIAAKQGWMYFQESQHGHGIAAGMAVAAGTLSGLSGWLFWRFLVQMTDHDPPCVQLGAIELLRGIPEERLQRFGEERFPNRVHRHWRIGLRVRGLLASVCSIPLAVVIYACFDDARASAWTEIILRPFTSMASCLVLPSEAIGLATVYVCGIALLLSVLNNGQYLLFTFPQTLVLQAVLVTQVTGFWTLCISFRRLRGKLGWFFGKRPEFFFPRLPFSWAMAATVIFLPPVIGIAGLWIARVGQEWLERVLP